MTENEIFGELRSAAQTPSAESWARIVAAIGQWRDVESFAQSALPYLAEQMKADGWADVARMAPASWAEARHPALGLADGLDLTKSALEADELIAVSTTRPDGAPGWRMVRLDGSRANATVLKALLGAEAAKTMTHLSLRGCKRADHHVIDVLAKADGLSELRELDLRDLKIEVESLKPLADSPLALQLSALYISGCRARHRDELFATFYRLMERLDGRMRTRGKKGGEALEEVRLRAAALHGMLEQQLVDWASALHADDDLEIEFGSFYDLME